MNYAVGKIVIRDRERMTFIISLLRTLPNVHWENIDALGTGLREPTDNLGDSTWYMLPQQDIVRRGRTLTFRVQKKNDLINLGERLGIKFAEFEIIEEFRSDGKLIPDPITA